MELSGNVTNTLVGAIAGLLVAIVTVFVIRVQKKKDPEERKRRIYEKYAEPLAVDSVNLLWRLDEILFRQRGQYLHEDAPSTPFNEDKLISTCYRIAAVIGWTYAMRRELRSLSVFDSAPADAASEALQHSMVYFESALADAPRTEVRVMNELARLWHLKLPADADRVARAAAQVAADMQHFLSSYALTRYHELATLDDARGLDVARQVAASITAILGHPPVSDQELVATCRPALNVLGVKQAWLYRDWQQAIGVLMIRRTHGSDRLFEVIAYGDFEALYREANPWLARLRDIVIGIDVTRPEPADLRLEQLRLVARATGSMVCSIETLDLNHRILDPTACDLARKILAELPAMVDAAA